MKNILKNVTKKDMFIILIVILFALYIIAWYIYDTQASKTAWQVEATQRIEESRATREELRKKIQSEEKISDCMKEKLTKVEENIEECQGL